jgi:hypothetical protein
MIRARSSWRKTDVSQGDDLPAGLVRISPRNFRRSKGGEYVTVKGVINGEAGVELKFCKLVRIE